MSPIIKLLDWEIRDDKYIMVLEHPSTYMGLFDFIVSKGRKITEDLAQVIMRQAIQAAIQCFRRRVFHMDIKLEDFMINTETFEVKLFDFGHADLLRTNGYSESLGMFYVTIHIVLDSL